MTAMADSTSTPEGFSLKRWSRRKLDAARAETPAPAIAAAPTMAAATAAAVANAPTATEATVSTLDDGAPSLPPIESLTPDSDFSAFMQPRVDEALKRAALKKLFTDPHFNVMDGLDIYIGDYTQSDPMPEGMLEKLGKVYGMAKEAVAGDVVAPDGSSTAPVDAAAPEPARDPATPTDEQDEATVAAQPVPSPALPPPDAPPTLPLLAPDAPASLPSRHVPETPR